MKVSLVIPVYNEIGALPDLIAEIRAALDGYDASYEVVLVDDGSSDGSGEWLDLHARQDGRLRPVHFVRNAGQSAAFAAGFQAATGDVVVTLDADGQNPPAEIPKLLDTFRSEGADVVAGFRLGRRDTRWRLFQSRLANGIRNRLTGETIRDTGCSLKAFRAALIRAVPLYQGMHRFLPTLCRLHGNVRVVEVGVTHRERTTGVSKYGMWNRAWRSFVDLLAVRWMQKRWIRYEVRHDH